MDKHFSIGNPELELTVVLNVTASCWRECYLCYEEIAPGKVAHEVIWENGYRDPYHLDCWDKQRDIVLAD